MEAVFGGFFIVALIIFVVVIATSVFWIWMLIDALMYEPTTEEKLLWALVILFLHVIGALIYFFVRRSQRGAVNP